MKKKLMALGMAAVLAFGAAGCGGGTDAKTDDTALEDFNIVLDWYPNAIHSFLYVAQEKGYFADEGLNLVINFPANTNDGISMPAAGKADIGIYYLQDAIQTAVEENVPIVSVGAVTQSSLNVVISLAKSGIKGAEDLAGKKIGYSGTALSEAQIASMLKNVGLSADDCQFVDVGFDLLTATTTGQVDATTGNMVNHEVPQLEEEGFDINYFYPTDSGLLLSDRLLPDNGSGRCCLFPRPVASSAHNGKGKRLRCPRQHQRERPVRWNVSCTYQPRTLLVRRR